MVLSSSNADTISTQAPWLDRLVRRLQAGHKRTLLRVVAPRPVGWRRLVLRLMTVDPNVYVVHRFNQLADLPRNALVLVEWDPSEAFFYNFHRNAFSAHALRAIVWLDPERWAQLHADAPDFDDWFSHHFELPSEVPSLTLATLQGQQRIQWTGEDLTSALHALEPSLSLLPYDLDQSFPYQRMRAHAQQTGWKLWKQALDPLRTSLVALAMAEGQDPAVLLDCPQNVPGWIPAHDHLISLKEGSELLTSVNCPWPDRAVALLDREPEGVALVAALLKDGVSWSEIAPVLLDPTVMDPAVIIAKLRPTLATMSVAVRAGQWTTKAEGRLVEGLKLVEKVREDGVKIVLQKLSQCALNWIEIDNAQAEKVGNRFDFIEKSHMNKVEDLYTRTLWTEFIDFPPSKTYDVFITYDNRNKIAARSIYKALKDIGLKSFLDEFEIMPGDDWDMKISQTLRNSQMIIVLIGKVIDNAYYLRDEMIAAIAYARKNRSRVIPIYLDEVPINRGFYFSMWKGINWNAEGGAIGVAATIKNLFHKVGLPILGSLPLVEAVPNELDRGTRYDVLKRLSSSQFEEILHIIPVPHEEFPPPTEPLTSKALALVQWLELQSVQTRLQFDQLLRRMAPGLTFDEEM